MYPFMHNLSVAYRLWGINSLNHILWNLSSELCPTESFSLGLFFWFLVFIYLIYVPKYVWINFTILVMYRNMDFMCLVG